MYQLDAQLSNGLSILIHMQMQAVETVRGERAVVHNMARDWRSVIDSFSHRYKLVFDSYYFSVDSVNVLEERSANGRQSRVKFSGAVTPTKFPLHGQSHYPRAAGRHSLVHYYNDDACLCRKYVLTNAYTQYLHLHDKTVVPVYNDYRVLFDKCAIEDSRGQYHSSLSPCM